ncbi:MAG: His/Gly/Thr/Pro-type tRNA ligase C-terminal domain-containing protein, partial [Patescibacteria group bacterium]|nr:His/Gly/Thr/Pro-type tRNA ligase C-terminal domain-containing protein [Patescibacteria group bacterium]
NNKEKPVVIIHRAIMGSFERFMAFILEKNCGYLPIWLTPIQVRILPLSEKFINYAQKIYQEIKKINIEVEIDNRNDTLNKKIKEAEILHVPYIIIIGEKEEKNELISLRCPTYYKQKYKLEDGEMSLEKFISIFSKLSKNIAYCYESKT